MNFIMTANIIRLLQSLQCVWVHCSVITKWATIRCFNYNREKLTGFFFSRIKWIVANRLKFRFLRKMATVTFLHHPIRNYSDTIPAMCDYTSTVWVWAVANRKCVLLRRVLPVYSENCLIVIIYKWCYYLPVYFAIYALYFTVHCNCACIVAIL